MALHADLHEKAPYHDGSFRVWSDTRSPATPFRFDDGVRFYMARVDVAPWDQWTTDPNASPEKPDDWDDSVAEQAPEQQD